MLQNSLVGRLTHPTSSTILGPAYPSQSANLESAKIVITDIRFATCNEFWKLQSQPRPIFEEPTFVSIVSSFKR